MRYIDENHSYVNEEDGEVYTSCTQFVKKYVPYRDWNEIAEKYAKKNKRDVEEVKASWKHEADISIVKGTAFHKKMEDKYSGEYYEIDGAKYKVYHNPLIDGVKVARPLPLEEGIHPEVVVYSHRYKLAGQADYIEIIDNKINIKDYKTNKKIDLESYKNWKTGHQMMSHPIQHIMDCNFWHYALQLNLYMYMLKSHDPNYEMGTMTLLHLTNEKDFFDNEVLKPYIVPDLQKDVQRMLEHHKQRQ